MSSIRKNFILKEAFTWGILKLFNIAIWNNSIEYFEEGLDNTRM